MQEIKKRLILKEDLNLDVFGNDEKVFFGDNNNLRQGKKINAGDIPLKQETRKKVAAVDVNTAIELIADKVENITASAVLEQDETIEFANNDSLSDIQLKINAQIKNLNGHTLTFKFPANLSQLLYSSIVFQDFYNGTVVVTGGEVENKIAVYDQLNINSLFRIYRCQCEVVIRNFYIVHQYSPFGISVESSLAVIVKDCSFSGNPGADSYAVNKSVANVILQDCTLNEDMDIYPPAEKQDQGIGKSIGEIFVYPASMPPEGAYLLNGQTIAHCRDLYPKFWEWVNSAGVRVIDDTTYESELASAGVCSGFVLDSAFGGVRLPKWKYQAPFGKTIPVRGNGISLGLSTGSVLGGLAAISGGYAGHSMIVESAYGAQVGQTVSADYVRGSDLAMGVTTDSDNSGIVAENNAPVDNFVWCIQVYNVATTLSKQESAQLASEMQTKAPITLNGNHVVRTVWDWSPNENGNISPPQYANQTISTHSGGEDLTVEFPTGARWAIVAVSMGSGSNYYEVTLDGAKIFKSGSGGYPTEHRCIVPGNVKQVLTIHVSGGGTKTSYVAFKK